MTAGTPPASVYSLLSASEEEAAARARQFKSEDPFPTISPALLNSADIEDYAIQTGMVFPFNPQTSLKPASYEVPFDGFCRYWDEKGEMRERTIHVGDSFRLRKNSIVFVQPKIFFRLPDYIAIRFNLQITHVHRGILLGTGPLVDPGFQGQLLIPLHNLTTNDYYLRGGEGLIWVEFTKVSANARWCKSAANIAPQYGRFAGFPDEKRNRNVDEYLYRAAPGRAIKSSVGEFVQLAEEAERQASEARDKVTKLLTLGAISGLFVLITLAVSIGLLYVSLYRFVDDFKVITTDRLSRIEQTLEER